MEKIRDVLKEIRNGSVFPPYIPEALAQCSITEVREAVGKGLNKLINEARGYRELEASYRAKQSEIESGKQFDIFGAKVPAIK